MYSVVRMCVVSCTCSVKCDFCTMSVHVCVPSVLWCRCALCVGEGLYVHVYVCVWFYVRGIRCYVVCYVRTNVCTCMVLCVTLCMCVSGMCGSTHECPCV